MYEVVTLSDVGQADLAAYRPVRSELQQTLVANITDIDHAIRSDVHTPIELGGEPPIKTSGGHTVESYMQCRALTIDAVRELRGQTGENDWVAIGIANDADWSRFCAASDRSELALGERFLTHDRRRANEAALTTEIEGWTGQRTKHAAMAQLQTASIRSGTILTGADMLAAPHLNERGYDEKAENLRSGQQTLRLAPYHLSETLPVVTRPAPTLGQDTQRVLCEVLGMSVEEIADLNQLGVTQHTPRGRRPR